MNLPDYTNMYSYHQVIFLPDSSNGFQREFSDFIENPLSLALHIFSKVYSDSLFPATGMRPHIPQKQSVL